MRELIAFIAAAFVVYVALRKLPAPFKEGFDNESDLMGKMRWVTKHYMIETDEHQRLLTRCYRVRVNRDFIFIDLCDDFFKGFHTLTYDKDGRFIEERFNEYCTEPTDASEYPSDLPSGEEIVVWTDYESHHFGQFR